MPVKLGNLLFYTAEEVAKDLNIHINTLRRYVRTNKIRGKKVGKKYLIQEESVRAFLAPEAAAKL